MRINSMNNVKERKEEEEEEDAAAANVKSLDLGEYRLNYATKGTAGPRMVMLHGADKRDDWTAWRSLLPLSSEYSLVIPDLIGFGGSSKPLETPDYKVQASVLHEMMDRLEIEQAVLMGASWGGQVALELAIEWPDRVRSLVLISSTYDKTQIPKIKRIARPTLIVWAEDDQIASLKAGYLLRDAIGTSRLEVLSLVPKDPRLDFTTSHKLQRYKSDVVSSMIRNFLSAPSRKIAEPPEMEPELRGMAMKEEEADGKGQVKGK